MKDLNNEQTEYAVKRLEMLQKARGLTRTELGEKSDLGQSTISKIFNGTSHPTREALTKIARALGLKLADVLDAPDVMEREMIGYLATPLTAVVQDASVSQELARVVKLIRAIADSKDFTNPAFDLYWPGEHTHPLYNAELSAQQVYLRDRSRAGTFDFIILFCASPSYGVGQENEIAAQAGIPAIRLVPCDISRMISGSFLKSIDVPYTGNLTQTVAFDEIQLADALRQVRRTHFSHKGLYQSLNGEGFGGRLRSLLDDRVGDYQKFADELGVSLSYVNVLMDEPLSVANPSTRLLKRMAFLLNVSVGYLIGEKLEEDPVWFATKASWDSWVEKTPGLDAQIALAMLREWKDNYRSARVPLTIASNRSTEGLMKEDDWDRRYQQRMRARQKSNANQANLYA